MSRPCVWVHDGAISRDDVAVRSRPDAALVFVFDEPELRREPAAFGRLSFVFAGVCELFGETPHPVKEVRVGDLAAEGAAFFPEHDCDTVCVTDSPDPRTRQVIAALKRDFRVVVYPRGQLTVYDEPPVSFERYWEKVSRQVLGYPAPPRQPG
jgi:hypothetical protein